MSDSKNLNFEIPVWAELMLCESWKLAFLKAAAATARRRPDIELPSSLVYDAKQSWSLDPSREVCRRLALRTHLDEDGLDLAWRMLASHPKRTLSFGFLDRLIAAHEAWCYSTSWDVIGDRVGHRINRWQDLRDGVETKTTDVFEATTDFWWNELEAEAAHQLKDKVAYEKEAAKPLPKPAASVADVEDGVLVLARKDKTMEGSLKDIAEKRLPLTLAPDPCDVRAALVAEFPHFAPVIDSMLVDVRRGDPIRLRPLLLVGAPGAGKSRLVRRLAESLGAKLRRYDAAATIDNAFGGTPRRWTTAEPCFPLAAIALHRVANPLVMVDEVDKGSSSTHNGNLVQSMMPLLERETSKSYPDQGISMEVDLSHVTYVATANDATAIPKALIDRMRVINVPSPGLDHLAVLVRSVLADVATDQALDPRWIAPLAGDELDVVARAWKAAGLSMRSLQRIVSGTLAAREATSWRH